MNMKPDFTSKDAILRHLDKLQAFIHGTGNDKSEYYSSLFMFIRRYINQTNEVTETPSEPIKLSLPEKSERK